MFKPLRSLQLPTFCLFSFQRAFCQNTAFDLDYQELQPWNDFYNDEKFPCKHMIALIVQALAVVKKLIFLTEAVQTMPNYCP